MITIITPTIPERSWLLAQALASVQAQTVPPAAHLIRCEKPPGKLSSQHIAAQRNALLKAVETEWLVCLDDDDLLQPTYIAEVTQRLENADVVYTWLSISDEKLGRIDATGWLSERVAAELREHNFIAACAAVRTEVLRAIGGWKILGGKYWSEDWSTWIRLADAGARFACVPKVLYSYRGNGWNTTTAQWVKDGRASALTSAVAP